MKRAILTKSFQREEETENDEELLVKKIIITNGEGKESGNHSNYRMLSSVV